MNGEIIKVVPQIKLLGTIMQSNLKWDSTTANLVNARMFFVVVVYIAYVRSILEQSAVVWHSGISVEIDRTWKEYKRVPAS